MDFAAGTVLNINKPSGITSFGVVRKVRGWTQCKKVGHAGTLDPLATGVLIVCTGKATKQVNEFVGQSKEYVATIRLGQSTSTDDAEGEVLEVKPVPMLDIDDIRTLLSEFVGTIDQVPPMFSALKKDGKRLYKLARKGLVVEREARQVEIYDIELIRVGLPELEIKVHCGKGTYIRSLARDLGDKIGCGGHLSSLVRTAIGDAKVENAWSMDNLKEAVLNRHETV
ncbi:tRNA pseudouridine(55) synthase TruB [bacterium]|nr:tRNA pseudouridine(55) synthase TruB [bacterium]